MTEKLRSPEQVLTDYMDNDRVVLVCKAHHYTAAPKQMPTAGCVDCAHVMIRNIIARQPGDKKEAVERLAAIVHGIIDLEAKGQWDYVQMRPKITIEKGEQ